jgi:hypothetical protein
MVDDALDAGFQYLKLKMLLSASICLPAAVQQGLF